MRRPLGGAKGKSERTVVDWVYLDISKAGGDDGGRNGDKATQYYYMEKIRTKRKCSQIQIGIELGNEKASLQLQHSESARGGLWLRIIRRGVVRPGGREMVQ